VISTDRRLWILLLATLVASACATPPQAFLHRAHRMNYALQPDELRKAHYYVSDRILAHQLSEDGAATRPDQVLQLEPETPGALTDAGPNWLRVSFGSGPGVLFVARPEVTPDSVYQLASDPEPGQEPRRVRDIPDRTVTVGSRRLKVIYGAEARLLIDSGTLEELIESRPKAGGRNPD
jgi:hypothetical protein